MKINDYVRILKGIATYLPFIKSSVDIRTGGTESARYCYSVWLRHLVIAKKNGLLKRNFDTVAELGPGDSIGTGIAALISGANNYYAFDVVRYANIEKNLKIFKELISLFKERADIPDHREFPKLKPYLKSYAFPKQILSDRKLDELLKPKRIAAIKNAIENMDKMVTQNKIKICYFVPWDDASIIRNNSIDIIFSQAVLEHVDKLFDTYRAMFNWLKNDGFISHTIDFKSHGFANEWNGHWLYSNFVWKLIRGKRPYLINREPYGAHINFINNSGFRLVTEIKIKEKSNINKKDLAGKFKNLSNDDFTTRGVFIQAVKK